MEKRLEESIFNSIQKTIGQLSLDDIEQIISEYNPKSIDIAFRRAIISILNEKKALNNIACDRSENWKVRCGVIKNLNDKEVLYRLISSEGEAEVIRSAASSRIIVLEELQKVI